MYENFTIFAKKNNNMNVLSLFDGLSCGQIALKEIGIIPDVYYASEIDKHAITQTQLNFPNTIQLGSVVDVDVSKLERIDLLLGGSPCQSFSFAGKRKGMVTKCDIEIYTLEKYLQLKSDGFEFEGQSYLFWEYMRILTDIRKYNPEVKFLLENVEMGSKWERILSEAIGIYGVHINSALVSAQNRKRIYWTNIQTKEVGLFGELHGNIPQPEDKGILLKDILEIQVDEKYYLSEKFNNWLEKHAAKRGVEVKHLDGSTKASCLTVTEAKRNLSNDYIVAMRGRENAVLTPKRTEYGKSIRKAYEAGTITEQRKNIQQLEPRTDGKTNTITSVQKDNLVMTQNYVQWDGVGFDQDNRAYFENGKSGTLDIKPNRQKTLLNDSRIRRLTPTECARLQTIPEWYKWGCSDTQQYKMLGNGWTIQVIAHILSFLPKLE